MPAQARRRRPVGWIMVYLVRHGQTEWNVQGRWQGRQDSPLTEQGVAQARLHAAALRSVPFATIFSSPTGRAFRTAQIIAEVVHLPVTVFPELAELDYGDWSGLTRSEAEVRFPDALAARSAAKYTYRFPGGESYADVDLRAGRALDCLQSSLSLIVSHEMVGRMLLRHLLKLTPDAALKLTHPQDVIYRSEAGRIEHSRAGADFKPGWPS